MDFSFASVAFASLQFAASASKSIQERSKYSMRLIQQFSPVLLSHSRIASRTLATLSNTIRLASANRVLRPTRPAGLFVD